MLSSRYIKAIQTVQETLIRMGLIILILVPLLMTYAQGYLPTDFTTVFFRISLASVFILMCIRPLADLFSTQSWIRALVTLRKGLGILSASIIVAFIFASILDTGAEYFMQFFSLQKWSLFDWKFLSPVGDMAAVLLLATSNRFSRRVLKGYWKVIQKLSYVYFYAGALYEYLFFQEFIALVYMVSVTFLTLSAFVVNRMRKAPSLRSV